MLFSHWHTRTHAKTERPIYKFELYLNFIFHWISVCAHCTFERIAFPFEIIILLFFVSIALLNFIVFAFALASCSSTQLSLTTGTRIQKLAPTIDGWWALFHTFTSDSHCWPFYFHRTLMHILCLSIYLFGLHLVRRTRSISFYFSIRFTCTKYAYAFNNTIAIFSLFLFGWMVNPTAWLVGWMADCFNDDDRWCHALEPNQIFSKNFYMFITI